LATFEGMKMNRMTCKEFVDSLAAFRYGDMTSPDRVRAEEQLTSGDKCSAYLRRYERTIDLARKLFLVPSLPGVDASLAMSVVV
jgi:hypothetical protein